MSNTIEPQRYKIILGYSYPDSEHGDWVTYDQHLQVVNDLKTRIADLEKASRLDDWIDSTIVDM